VEACALGLGYHPARAAPGVRPAVLQLLEAAHGRAHRREVHGRQALGVGDPGLQTLVAGQAEDLVHALGLAPGQDGLAAGARVRPQRDRHLGPARADLLDQARDLVQRALAGIDAGAPQPSAS
jgi:hypothetical protein